MAHFPKPLVPLPQPFGSGNRQNLFQMADQGRLQRRGRGGRSGVGARRRAQPLQLRPNDLIGVTGALAITTLVLAILTDWDGEGSSEDAAPVQASFAIAPELAALQLSGSF